MKKLIAIILLVALLVSVVGCSTQAERVAYNLSQQADNFNFRGCGNDYEIVKVKLVVDGGLDI